MVSLILIVTSFVLALLAALLSNYWELGPWRRTAGQHWSQRARALYPARVNAGLNALLLPVILAEAATRLEPALPDGVIVGVAAAAVMAVLIANNQMARQIFGGATPFYQVPLSLLMLALAMSPWIFLVIGTITMPPNFGIVTWLVAGGILLWYCVTALGFWRALMRCLGLLRKPDAHLQSIVAALAAKMGVRVRGVWVVKSSHANAYALPLARQILLTSTLCATLTDDQVSAICAHELGHLTEARRVKALRHFGFLVFFPLVFAHPLSARFALGPLLVWAMIALTLAVPLVLRRMRRRMEVRADVIATRNTADGVTYARALERLYEVNQMPAVMPGRRKIHPHLYDRMLAAGVTPDFPRPEPPRRFTRSFWVLLVLIVVLAVHSEQRFPTHPSPVSPKRYTAIPETCSSVVIIRPMPRSVKCFAPCQEVL